MPRSLKQIHRACTYVCKLLLAIDTEDTEKGNGMSYALRFLGQSTAGIKHNLLFNISDKVERSKACFLI